MTQDGRDRSPPAPLATGETLIEAAQHTASGASTVPQTLDALRLRSAFGLFPTGVAVVTARGSDGARLGMTINSLSSLSLDPALLTWNIARRSRNHEVFTRARHFAIHVLGQDQAALCKAFVMTDQDRFGQIATTDSVEGVPLIRGCLARFECRTHQLVEGGDHTLVVGQVLRIAEQPGQPLVFFRGQLGQLAPRD